MSETFEMIDDNEHGRPRLRGVKIEPQHLLTLTVTENVLFSAPL